MHVSMPRPSKVLRRGSMRRRRARRSTVHWDLRRRCSCGDFVLGIQRDPPAHFNCHPVTSNDSLRAMSVQWASMAALWLEDWAEEDVCGGAGEATRVDESEGAR